MCSVFGFIRRGRKPVSERAVAQLVHGNIGRGPHAWGIAWIDQAGAIQSYRTPGRADQALDLIQYVARRATMLIGHLRWATHGDAADNINNHPHPSDGGWVVHNGIVYNYEQVAQDMGLLCSSACDSEVLALGIAGSRQRSLVARTVDVVERCDGAAGLVLLGLWKRSLVIARRGNPLSQSGTDDCEYFSSLAAGLIGRAVSIPDNVVMELNGTGQIVRRMNLATRRAYALAQGGEYAGG